LVLSDKLMAEIVSSDKLTDSIIDGWRRCLVGFKGESDPAWLNSTISAAEGGENDATVASDKFDELAGMDKKLLKDSLVGTSGKYGSYFSAKDSFPTDY
jgi:hypothetical protein